MERDALLKELDVSKKNAAKKKYKSKLTDRKRAEGLDHLEPRSSDSDLEDDDQNETTVDFFKRYIGMANKDKVHKKKKPNKMVEVTAHAKPMNLNEVPKVQVETFKRPSSPSKKTVGTPYVAYADIAMASDEAKTFHLKTTVGKPRVVDERNQGNDTHMGAKSDKLSTRRDKCKVMESTVLSIAMNCDKKSTTSVKEKNDKIFSTKYSTQKTASKTTAVKTVPGKSQTSVRPVEVPKPKTNTRKAHSRPRSNFYNIVTKEEHNGQKDASQVTNVFKVPTLRKNSFPEIAASNTVTTVEKVSTTRKNLTQSQAQKDGNVKKSSSIDLEKRDSEKSCCGPCSNEKTISKSESNTDDGFSHIRVLLNNIGPHITRGGHSRKNSQSNPSVNVVPSNSKPGVTTASGRNHGFKSNSFVGLGASKGSNSSFNFSSSFAGLELDSKVDPICGSPLDKQNETSLFQFNPFQDNPFGNFASDDKILFSDDDFFKDLGPN
eukprot:CAMPEP_0115038740 /NCGR_PEP_ID=MMETSP0216-20121206/43598_1 /TAXON_ID=223996 /ORGANISM="Protocruzia adherens, Strain Boccale" /LENGTH=489 /DNA_ID=CAMNT_0002419217 /DNA_START=254 /DNA_END=1723 /DNA_ORIENTATION=+